MIETILNLPQPIVTGILVATFIGLLYLAFKVMSIIFQTTIVAVLSAVLYTGLAFLIGGVEFTLNDMLLFSVLGAGLYMFYTVLATAISTVETLLKVPIAILSSLFSSIKTLVSKLYGSLAKHAESFNSSKDSDDSSDDKFDNSSSDDSNGDDNDDSPSTKEVVLGEMDD